MALARTFEDLHIWQLAKGLFVRVHETFASPTDFVFRDQIRRAALSVMSNIAEGFEKRSRRDFARYLDTAKGSCGEVRSILRAASEVHFIPQNRAEELIAEAQKLSAAIALMLKKLRPQPTVESSPAFTPDA